MKKKIGLFFILISEILIFILEKKYIGTYFSIDRFLIMSYVAIFIVLHFILDINKMYNFIYKYRYYIGGVFLLYVTIMGYHGSSIAAWNSFIEPNTDIDGGGLLLGVVRMIRGDEFLVGTPIAMSQIFNNFSKYNSILTGTTSLVAMFPSLPCKSLSILGNLFNIAYFILPFNNAFSFIWYGKLLMIFFASFELSMLITNKNKLYSLMGSLLISFSPFCSWWSLTPILGYGALAIILLNRFYKNNKKKKIIDVFLFSLVGISYILLMYPAWQVPFGYVYLVLIIWITVNNKDNLSKKDLLYLLLTIILVFVPIILIFKESFDIYLLTINTVYPGSRFINGGYGHKNLINYVVNIFFPVIPFDNPCEPSNFISMYPLPIIMGIVNFIKKKKIDLLTLLLIICGLFLSIWEYIKLPNIFIKLSLLSFSTPERSGNIIGYICILLLLRIMTLYEKNNSSKKKKLISFVLGIIFTTTICIIMKNEFSNYINNYMFIIMLLVFIPITTLIILNDKKYNKYLAIYMCILSIGISGTVNPITKGFDVIYEKPFAKEVRKIIDADNNSRWITVDAFYGLPNYLVANGAITVNSTNFYPNLDLWKKLDPEDKYENIYNRYEHILITLTNDTTSFELINQDLIQINLNINDLSIMDVSYIASQSELNFDILVKIYDNDGMYIYKVMEENNNEENNIKN